MVQTLEEIKKNLLQEEDRKDLNEIKLFLRGCAATIWDLRKKQQEAKSIIAQVDESLKLLSAEAMNEILLDRDNGKPKFSNETARANELLIRLAKDERYRELLKQKKQAEANLQEIELNSEYHQNKAKNVRTLADILVSELNLLSRISQELNHDDRQER